MKYKRRSHQHPDYPRLAYIQWQHEQRFKAYVEAHGVPCQECRGRGGYTEVVTDEGQGPWYDCAWCLGTCRTTRHLKGLWLRWKRDEKRKAA